MCARNNLIFKFDRNSYDKSTVEEIVNSDFINKCLSESENFNYNLNPNWQESLKKESFDDPLNTSGKNRNMKSFDKKISEDLLPIVKKLVNHHHVFASGHYIYPPTGFMGWHTNYEMPCKRFYITYASEDKKSFFRYRHPETKEIITDYDDKGITLREFNVTQKPPYFWHCVGSDCIRISLGYRVNPPYHISRSGELYDKHN